MTVSDLQDRSESEQSGWGLQTGTGRSIQGNKDGSTTTRNGNTGTTTVSLSSEGHKKEGETQATLGQGSITVGGSSLDGQEQYADLNRDVNEGQITTLDQQTGGLNLPNTRLAIGENGTVAIQGDQTLFLNFGSRERAEEFLLQRINQGTDGAQIKTFQVEQSFFDAIKRDAVPENLARQFPDRPIAVDTTKAPNQFGLRPAQFQDLMESILPGSGKNGKQ